MDSYSPILNNHAFEVLLGEARGTVAYFFLYWERFLSAPGKGQGLLMTLSSEIIPGCAQWIICGAKDRT